jgi:uncharacterized protein
MTLALLRSEFGVARLGPSDPIPAWATQGSLFSITRTEDELSVVCDAAAIPADVGAERGWRCLRVVGRLDFALTGVLASLATPLAAAGVSLFAVSTFDTDYILVRTHALDTAIASLRRAGHDVVSPC